MIEDLRSRSERDFWARFEAMMGEDGLLTYRYLGRRTVALHDVTHDSMRVRGDMRNPAGGLMAAPLAIASAESGGFTDIESIPAPVSADLHILDDGQGVEEILVRRSFVQMGRTMGFAQAEIVDAADPARVIALTDGIGVRLAAAPPGFRPVESGSEIADAPDLPPLHAVFGAERGRDGLWRLPRLEPRIASTSASLHIGPTHILLERAATDLAEDLAGCALQIEGWSVNFTARGTHGPFAAQGAANIGCNGRIAARLTLHDEGRDNRPIATAIGLFRPVGPQAR